MKYFYNSLFKRLLYTNFVRFHLSYQIQLIDNAYIWNVFWALWHSTLLRLNTVFIEFQHIISKKCLIEWFRFIWMMKKRAWSQGLMMMSKLHIPLINQTNTTYNHQFFFAICIKNVKTLCDIMIIPNNDVMLI